MVKEIVVSETGLQTDLVAYSEVFEDFPNGVTNEIIDPIDCTVDPKLTIFTGEVQFDPGDWGNTYGKPRWQHQNYNSLVIRLDFGAASFLFTGDLQDKAIDYMLNKYSNALEKFDVDVYQVGHHGSHNATTLDLLTAMSPSFSIISASNKDDKRSGTAYAYGHPNMDVVQMLNHETSSPRDEMLSDALVYDGGWDNQSRKNDNQEFLSIDRAVYCTCWDNSIKLEVSSNGSIRKL